MFRLFSDPSSFENTSCLQLSLNPADLSPQVVILVSRFECKSRSFDLLSPELWPRSALAPHLEHLSVLSSLSRWFRCFPAGGRSAFLRLSVWALSAALPVWSVSGHQNQNRADAPASRFCSALVTPQQNISLHLFPKSEPRVKIQSKTLLLIAELTFSLALCFESFSALSFP